jgi:hypothetical protein
MAISLLTDQEVSDAIKRGEVDVSEIVGWERVGDVASNFDHVWQEDVAAKLCAKPNAAWGFYAAWDFCALVWFDSENFNAQVKVYQVIKETISAPDGPTLMKVVSDKYGYA